MGGKAELRHQRNGRLPRFFFPYRHHVCVLAKSEFQKCSTLRFLTHANVDHTQQTAFLIVDSTWTRAYSKWNREHPVKQRMHPWTERFQLRTIKILELKQKQHVRFRFVFCEMILFRRLRLSNVNFQNKSSKRIFRYFLF